MSKNLAAWMAREQEFQVHFPEIEALLGEKRLPRGFVNRMAVGNYAVQIKNYSFQHARRRNAKMAPVNALVSGRAHYARSYSREDSVGGAKVRVFYVLHNI